MDAIILAAGLGMRLRPYTNDVPKPLLKIQDRPILDWILQSLPPSVEQLIVVVNYLAEQIEDYLKRQHYFPKWRTVYQEKPSGTGDAFRSCKPHLVTDHYLVLNGDDLYAGADLLKLSEVEAGLLAYPVENPSQFGILITHEDGTLAQLVEKPDMEGPQLANIGAYMLPRVVFEHELQRSARGEYEITDYVNYLIGKMPVKIIEATFWYPISTVEAWQEAEQYVQGMQYGREL